MNNRSSKFVPIPKSMADISAMRVIANAVNALLNGRIVAGNTNDILYSDGNTIWQVKSGGSASLSTFVIVSDGGDYYNCNTWDGTTAGGTIVKVAKNQDLRCILPTASPAGGAWAEKVIRGITYTYTYTPVAGSTTDGVNVVEYTRSVTGSDGSSETDNVTPCLNVGDIISAYSISFTGPETLVGITWQALTDGRAWASQ